MITNIILLALLFIWCHQSNGQNSPPAPPPISNGYTCSPNPAIYPCQSYAFYRAGSGPTSDPTPPDLPSVADLFNLTRRTLAKTSNLTANSTLSPNQPLLIPLTCACNFNISYYATSYTIAAGDTFYRVASYDYGNLTSYPAVEKVNPTLIATNLSIGDEVVFPIFCGCPVRRNGSTKNIIITYTFQPGDNYSAIAADFGTDVGSLVAMNGPERSATPYLTILVPVSRVPPPVVVKAAKNSGKNVSFMGEGKGDDRKGTVIGLAIGLGLVGLLWIASLGVLGWFYLNRRRWVDDDEDRRKKYGIGDGGGGKGKKFGRSVSDEKLMSDITEWLDKYKLYGVEELMEATAGFDESRLIQGSVYRGVIDGEVYAIKKMKWNACDQLKILQKVI